MKKSAKGKKNCQGDYIMVKSAQKDIIMDRPKDQMNYNIYKRFRCEKCGQDIEYGFNPNCLIISVRCPNCHKENQTPDYKKVCKIIK